MKAPIFVRPLTDGERGAVEAGLRSSAAFTLRRCQIVRASADGVSIPQIARNLGCNEQTVRNAVHAFNTGGTSALTKGSHRAHTIHRALDAAAAATLRELLHRSPRDFGYKTSLWTLDLAATEAFKQGLTDRGVSGETIRATLVRLGVRWLRAKEWITSPDPEYARKKRRRDRLIRWAAAHPDWALGFEDEVWWSRLAAPALHAWADDDRPLRLVEQTVAKDDPDKKALACYGLLLPATNEVWLRFLDGRPVSAVSTVFLDWCCQELAARGTTALLLVWDNASWHISRAVQTWIGEHNRQVKQAGQGVRLIVCPLPIKSPWLNPIEPRWVHTKRRVVEPTRLLPARELAERVCDALDCTYHTHIPIPDKAAVRPAHEATSSAPAYQAYSLIPEKAA